MVGDKELTKKIAQIIPCLFDDSLIIALSKNWINKFGTMPKFEVLIDGKGRLVIQSEDSLVERRHACQN